MYAGAAGGLPAHEGPPRRGGRPRGQEEGEEVVHGRSIKGECAKEGLESLVPPLRDPPCVDESWQSKEIISVYLHFAALGKYSEEGFSFF